MNAERTSDDEQVTLWNGVAGRAWVEAQEVLDTMFKPIEDRLVESVSPESIHQVLDVGCGTGSTTLAMARRLGANGRCIGIDLSEPMTLSARSRAERERSTARFLRGDAQQHSFTSATFDLIISRFGVMFFDDPIAAFANLRCASRDNGELRFFAWRSAEENPFMTTAEHAAAPFLPNIPARLPDAPGQFAFASQGRVHRILERSGWREIDIQPIDVACTFPENELLHYLTRLGPLGRILEHADEAIRKQVIETVRAAFERYVQGAEVRFDAACWLVNARAGIGASV